METIEKSISVMDRFFFYFPVFHAVRKEFFNFLPPGVRINYELAGKQSDLGVLRELFLPTTRDSIWFALADPAGLLDLSDEELDNIVILSAIVKNTPFWAVDHKKFTASSLKDLAKYNTIVCYDPGTTSYRVASRIKDTSTLKNVPQIESTLPPHEINQLSIYDDVNRLVLTPELPRLYKIMHISNGKLGIELSISDTPEFSDMITTALFTKREILNHHRDTIIGVIAGIECAMKLAYNQDPDFKLDCIDFFPEHRKNDVEKALIIGREKNIFSSDIELQQAPFVRAIQAAKPKDDQYEIQDYAVKLYNKIKPDSLLSFRKSLYQEASDLINNKAVHPPGNKNIFGISKTSLIVTGVLVGIMIFLIFYASGLGSIIIRYDIESWLLPTIILFATLIIGILSFKFINYVEKVLFIIGSSFAILAYIPIISEKVASLFLALMGIFISVFLAVTLVYYLVEKRRTIK